MSTQKAKEALNILEMICREIPRTLGEPNVNLIYEDVCSARNKLKEFLEEGQRLAEPNEVPHW